MKRHFAYLKYVLRHKWFVFVACRQLRVPLWRALVHDWTKFLPSEWFGYARAFYDEDGSKRYQETELERPWNHHQKRNKHHWQYWLLTWDRGVTTPIKMPETYAREMLADWIGAGRAITGKVDTAAWYLANQEKIRLHVETRGFIELLLDAPSLFGLRTLSSLRHAGTPVGTDQKAPD